MSEISSVNFSFNRLRTVKRAEKFSHVHGEFIFEIGKRRVPFDWCRKYDACFNDLLNEFVNLMALFKTGANRYSIDEAEQGQPVFEFERAGEKVYFSINDSEISGGVADSRWQRVSFEFADFVEAFQKFAKSFLKEIADKSTRQAESWATLLERIND